MTPEERRLIEDLFDRMQSYGAPEKDRAAESLIRDRVRAMPDAVYMLTQSVLVQDQALQAANERVMELEERVRQLEDSQPPPRRSGGFLSGGFMGRGRGDDAPPSSVPQVGARASPSSYDRPSVWGNQQPPPSAPPPAQPAGGGGGFMRSAMATAAGVAGGMLAAESIRNMLGGSHARAAETGGAEHQRDLDRQQDLEQDRQMDEDRQQDLEQDRQMDEDQQQDLEQDQDAADDGFDGDDDYGDDSMDV
jgi:hypothetical protein